MQHRLMGVWINMSRVTSLFRKVMMGGRTDRGVNMESLVLFSVSACAIATTENDQMTKDKTFLFPCWSCYTREGKE